MSIGVRRGFDPEALAAARRQRGLSRGDLARLADISPAAVASLETGRRQPQVDSLARIAAALGIAVRDLVPIPDEQRHLSDLRVHAGLTQAALAAAIGVSPTRLGALERAEQALADDLARRLADALSVSPSTIRAAWTRARARPSRTPA
ncbi:XRE family transcriptional regulator (plasmid) [Amycolatopsis sp. AA4]|uniref:helix-turn-helix transcriptional regulator n=1 Tax=Actinomycetes TaxID=1760 RepID=UPI0001B57684|nr:MULTISPECIES: helix-turn-helix transcriptional regulator [Actinomycetes]ATY17237.1 XRE family transcriptional regulator [Amycolatopsis sp. AA4]EFL12706.1 hypothetical protein SSMG_08377 [Streptomyces sp. AA4]